MLKYVTPLLKPLHGSHTAPHHASLISSLALFLITSSWVHTQPSLLASLLVLR